MQVTKCDMCKKETALVATIKYDCDALHRHHSLIDMQGTRGGSDEFCPDCYRKVCWAIGNVWQGKYVPTNPTEEEA